MKGSYLSLGVSAPVTLHTSHSKLYTWHSPHSTRYTQHSTLQSLQWYGNRERRWKKHNTQYISIPLEYVGIGCFSKMWCAFGFHMCSSSSFTSNTIQADISIHFYTFLLRRVEWSTDHWASLRQTIHQCPRLERTFAQSMNPRSLGQRRVAPRAHFQRPTLLRCRKGSEKCPETTWFTMVFLRVANTIHLVIWLGGKNTEGSWYHGALKNHRKRWSFRQFEFPSSLHISSKHSPPMVNTVIYFHYSGLFCIRVPVIFQWNTLMIEMNDDFKCD